jgi:hypothetical protein
VGDTVVWGYTVRESQWEIQWEKVRESQWEKQWREGEGVAVGDTVRDAP